MYKTAKELIFNGLSPFARYMLGFFSLLFGSVVHLVAPPTDKAILFHAFGVFCLLISVACFTQGRIRQFVGSVIGCMLFLISGWHLYAQLTGGPLQSDSRGEPSVINSISFFILFGIPGAAYALKARFGWRQDELNEKH